jgi:hypothetical protein
VGNSVIYQKESSVGVGTTAPAATLEVDGTAKVDGNLSLGGNILSNKGGPIIQAPTSGSYNFSAGLGTLPPSTTGSGNTAVGTNALSANTSGFDNTATGDAALFNNTAGANNMAAGSFALLSNTTGGFNVAAGFAAMFANTTGSDNTAIGSGVMAGNTTGSNNMASGEEVLQFNTTGNDNTAVGTIALLNNATGSGNIAGYYAGYNVTSSNNIEIGNQGTSSDNGFIRIGTAGTQTSAFIASIYGAMTNANNAVPVVIDSNGNLGTISSSQRYKEDIQDMGDASSGLLRLRPVTLRYKKPFADGSKPIQYGLIAEEVAEVYPDLVTRSAEGQVETVNYRLLDPMLLNELQKQNLLIAGQEQIQAQKDQMCSLE